MSFDNKAPWPFRLAMVLLGLLLTGSCVACAEHFPAVGFFGGMGYLLWFATGVGVLMGLGLNIDIDGSCH